jgi:hypothetical protein
LIAVSRDVPLDVAAGEIIANLVVEEGLSVY